MGLLDGKRLLITGVITDASIAFSVAQLAQEQGATIVLTGFGRMSLVAERVAKRLPDPPPVVELDVTVPAHIDSLAERVREHVATGSTACSTRSASPRRPAWAGVSSTRRGRTWRWPCRSRRTP